MNELEVFITLAIAHAIAVVSPGPDFAIIVRYSLVYGRNLAMWTSMGIGTGILVHVFYSIVGIGILVATNQVIFTIFKYTGAAYLLFLAYQGWRSGEQHKKKQEAEKAEKAEQAEQAEKAEQTEQKQAAEDLPSQQYKNNQQTPKPFKAYRDGLLTNALNIKASMFFLALFLLVTYDSLPVFQLFYGLYLAVATACYFCLLSWFFAKFHPVFRHHLASIEKGTALLLAFLALLLILFTGQPDFS